MELAGRGFEKLRLVRIVVWGLDSSTGTEFRDPEQVVRGTHQISSETGPRDPSIAAATEVADGLHPAEDLLDPLADALANGVSGPAGSAQVKRRAARSPLILRHMR